MSQDQRWANAAVTRYRLQPQLQPKLQHRTEQSSSRIQGFTGNPVGAFPARPVRHRGLRSAASLLRHMRMVCGIASSRPTDGLQRMALQHAVLVSFDRCEAGNTWLCQL